MAYTTNERYEVTRKTFPVVSRQGGMVENGRLVYTAWVQKFEQETGGPAVPLKGQFVDDRQCKWTISGHMERQYFVNSMHGADNPIPASAVQIPLVIDGQSNGLASFLDHDPCSDYRGRIDEGVEAMKRKIVEIFDQTAASDIEAFKKERSGIVVEILAA